MVWMTGWTLEDELNESMNGHGDCVCKKIAVHLWKAAGPAVVLATPPWRDTW